MYSPTLLEIAALESIKWHQLSKNDVIMQTVWNDFTALDDIFQLFSITTQTMTQYDGHLCSNIPNTLSITDLQNALGEKKP